MSSESKRSSKKVRSHLAEVKKDRMDKTVVVAVKRTFIHPVYKKVIRRSTQLKAHDERNECKVGDQVRIVETRPISKGKQWRVTEVVKRSGQLASQSGRT